MSTIRDDPAVAAIDRHAEPLPPIGDAAFGAMFDRFAGARFKLLGEASHGTSEFYRARAAITRRLVEQHGFTMVSSPRAFRRRSPTGGPRTGATLSGRSMKPG